MIASRFVFYLHKALTPKEKSTCTIHQSLRLKKQVYNRYDICSYRAGEQKVAEQIKCAQALITTPTLQQVEIYLIITSNGKAIR